MTNIPFTFNSYDLVARVNGQTPIFYRMFGSYQGEWLMIGADKENYYIYKDYYGSCSGCDSLEAEDPQTLEDAKKFAEGYPPFAVVPKEVMKNKAVNGTLREIFPANLEISLDGETTWEALVEEISVIVKSLEGVVSAKEILSLKNLEIRREAVDRYGEERFMEDLGAEIIDKNNDNYLMRVEQEPPFVFLKLKDSSTDRRYMLRVPPEIKSVLGGIAWSFGLEENDYKPEVET